MLLPLDDILDDDALRRGDYCLVYAFWQRADTDVALRAGGNLFPC